MRKSKLLILLVLAIIIVMTLASAFIACDRNKKPIDDKTPSGNSGESGDFDSGDSGDRDSGEKPPVKPVIKLDQKQALQMVIDGVDAPDKEPEKAFNINFSAKVSPADSDEITTMVFQCNLYSDVKNEALLGFYVQGKDEPDEARRLKYGLYLVNGKLYLDLGKDENGQDRALLYLSDIDLNYIIKIVEQIPGIVGDDPIAFIEDLIKKIKPGTDIKISPLIELLIPMLFGKPTVTGYDYTKVVQNFSMEIRLRDCIVAISSLLGGDLPIEIPINLDLNILFNYLLENVIPDAKFYLDASFDKDGTLNDLELKSQEGLDLSTVNFDLSVGTEAADIDIPAIEEVQVSEFSLTNINFAIDLMLGTSQNADGSIKKLDVGKLINGFMGQNILPVNLLMLQGGTGLRLQVALDLDLNYEKAPEDNNKLAIELFLIDQEGNYQEFDGGNPVPQLGIYYTEGSFYLNLDRMIPDYMRGVNLKVDADLSNLIDALVKLITDAIDGVFGISYDDIKNSEMNVLDNGMISTTSGDDVVRLMSSAAANGTKVLALSGTGDGDTMYVSAGVQGFIGAIAELLMLPENIVADNDSIDIIVNNAFLASIGSFVEGGIPFAFPEFMGDIILSIKFSEIGLDSVNVEASIVDGQKEPELDIKLKIWDFLIGTAKENLDVYISDRVDTENTSYINSLNGVVDKVLGGVTMSSRFTISFNKGTYNLAPFIAGFGVPQLANTDLLWNFTEDFMLDAQLNIQLSLNRQNAAQSQLVVELKTLNGIKVGETEIIAPDTVMLGIYGYKNQIFIDLSNLKVASITLPKLSFNLNFSDLVYTLLGDQINKLLESANITGGDFDFAFDLVELLGLNKKADSSSESTVSLANGDQATTEGGESALSEEEQSAIIFGLDTDRIYATVTLAAIMAILSQTQTEVGANISEALSLMEIQMDMEMGRKNGFSFIFKGELIPMLDSEGVSVYYYDQNGEKLPSKDADGNIIHYTGEEYTSKKYNYGSDMVLTFRAGNIGVEGEEDNPIVVGDLGNQKFDMDKKIGEFEQYQSDLVQAIVSTVGEATIRADIDLATLNNEMNLTNIINNILASSGQKLNLPIKLNLDDWNSNVQLLLQWDLDLQNSANSTIVMTLAYEGKQIFGVYIYRNSLMIDLEGLGFFQAEIVNSSIISTLFESINKVVGQIEGLDLNTLIGNLLKQNGLPTIPGMGENSDDSSVAEDEEAAASGEDQLTTDIIKYILQAVGLENTKITANISAALFSEMLNAIAGINLGFDVSIGADLDLFGGNEFMFNIGVEDIETTIKMQLAIGEKPEVNLDYDAIPDWDATNGEAFTKAMLDNLNIGFTIDIANFTGDTEATAGTNEAIYTRVIIEKLKASKQLLNTASNVTAPSGAFLITLAHIDEARYNNINDGTMTPLLYVILDYTKTSGQLRIVLCQNVINFVVDLGNYIDIAIDLDLVGTLAPVFDNLFSQIDGALEGLENIGQNKETSTQETPDSGIETQAEPAATEEPTGFAKIFAELDIVALLGGGINASLLSNGNFTVNINFDTYLINKLIDDVLSMVFGPNTILNLAELAPDIFSTNYLSKVIWTREYRGEAYDTTSFWGTLSTQIPPILSDVIRNLAGISIADWAIKPLIGGVLGQIRGITAGILPFAVFNEFTANIEVADATIANISIEGFDWGQNITDPNGTVVYDASKSGRKGNTNNNSVLRRDGYFTSIKIYNTSESVGKPVEGNDKFPEGIVTWDGIPTQITFDPYAYVSVDAGEQYLINEHFTGKQASYQRAQDLYKTEVQFTIINENGTATQKDISLLDLSVAGTYVIQGVAKFNNGVERILTTTITVLDDGKGIASIEPVQMHVYDNLPDFVTLVMNDGTTRKIHTRYITFQNYEPQQYTEHTVTGSAVMANGTVVNNVEFRYLDSTITQINIEGAQGNVITIDLYDYNIRAGQSSINDYISDTVFFKYSDGLSTGLEVGGEWVLSGANEFFARTLDKEGMWSTDVSGTQFSATNTIGSGATAQEVELIFTVKAKKVAKLTVNGLENTLRVDPYRYYMYLITGDEQYNPFTSTAIAEYYDSYMSADGTTEIVDSYSEEVNITWSNYSGVDFSWDNNNTGSTSITASLDNAKYPNSSFTWDFSTKIVVLRNEVEGIYFDKDLTQYTYYIDPFEYFINEEKGIANYPDHAYVKFTNGAVYYMPIKWLNTEELEVKYANQFAQLRVQIGFDDANKLKGVIGEFKQEAIVNVRVEDLKPVGIELAGSELTGGTYYIDPVQVNFFGMKAFPDTVTVKYDNGKTTVLPVDEWIYDFSLDSLKGQKNLKATAKITDSYQYSVNVEIIDRSAITTDLKELTVDPYTFTLDEKGNRVYSAFTNTILTYVKVGTIDIENMTVVGDIKTASGSMSTEYAQYVMYVINYTAAETSENAVYSTKSWEEAQSFIQSNKAAITSTEVRVCYDAPAKWDLSEINYAVADTYVVRVSAGTGASQKTFRVNATIVDKKVTKIGNTYYTIAWGGDNLTEEQKLTNKIVTSLVVYFSDGTSGSYECTIDISKIAYTNENDYTLLMTVETNEDGTSGKVVYKDSQGRVLDTDEARMNAALDVNVTIFSGDITINTTMKLHVLKQVMTQG